MLRKCVSERSLPREPEAFSREPRVGEIMSEPSSPYHAFARPAVDELKRKSVRGELSSGRSHGVAWLA